MSSQSYLKVKLLGQLKLKKYPETQIFKQNHFSHIVEEILALFLMLSKINREQTELDTAELFENTPGAMKNPWVFLIIHKRNKVIFPALLVYTDT